MHSLTASLPQHLYGYVRREFVTNSTSIGIEKCVIHAVSCRPCEPLTFSVLLESGAQYRGIPIHGLIVGQDPTQLLPSALGLTQHQVWGCFGTEFSIVEMTYCDGMSAEWCDSEGTTFRGRGLGWAIEFNGDGYSNAPQQDKSFNMLVSDEGYLAAMPNNRVRWYDDSFNDWSLPINLRVNHKKYYVEQIGVSPESTAYVKE
jgi:hypothetical protein